MPSVAPDSEVERARRDIVGRWLLDADVGRGYVPTPRASELWFRADGTFEATVPRTVERILLMATDVAGWSTPYETSR